MKAFLTLLFCFFYFTSHACECVYGSLKQSFESSEYVIKVRVIEITDSIQYDLYSNPTIPPFQRGNRPVLSVQQVYKGQLLDKDIKLSASDSMCDYYFELGNEYVIFIDRVQGHLVTSVCKNNFELTDEEALQEVQRLSNQ